MNLFGIGRAFAGARTQQRQADALRQEADSFELASDGGYLLLLKGVLFALFGYYNARLFIVTVHGWEGYLTAGCALAGEGTALYCINNYTKSAGWHRIGLGLFGVLLTLFSITHATISFFRMEANTNNGGKVHFYCENVAFPLLFSLLLLAAVVIPALHWRKKIAAEQAKAQVQIASSRARLVGESAALRNESELERERLDQLGEKIKLEGEYITKLQQFVGMKEREREVVAGIADADLREQVAAQLGLNPATLPASPQVAAQGRRIAPLPPMRRFGLAPATAQAQDPNSQANRP